jgi:hypothetical protein
MSPRKGARALSCNWRALAHDDGYVSLWMRSLWRPCSARCGQPKPGEECARHAAGLVVSGRLLRQIVMNTATINLIIAALLANLLKN